MKKILLHKRLLLLAAIKFNVLLPMEQSKVINSIPANKTEIDLRKSFDEYCINTDLQGDLPDKNGKIKKYNNATLVPGLREFAQFIKTAKIKFTEKNINIFCEGLFHRLEGVMEKKFTLILTPTNYDVKLFEKNIKIFYGLVGYFAAKIDREFTGFNRERLDDVWHTINKEEIEKMQGSQNNIDDIVKGLNDGHIEFFKSYAEKLGYNLENEHKNLIMPYIILKDLGVLFYPAVN